MFVKRCRFVAGAAAAASLTLSMTIAAMAGPAYTAKDVLAFIQQQAAIADAKATKGKTRPICFKDDDDPDCAPPQPFNLLLNFEFDSDHLTAPAKVNLSEFAKALKDPGARGRRFEIDGYTDATGEDSYNQNLSERRARSALNFLISSGAPRSALSAKGFGKSNPKVASDPFSPENRRVEFRLVTE